MSTYRKKMIEVALPLEAINKASAREKSIRHGHPSTLHLWWARRPLAACRAVLFASLVDDPDSDPEYRKPNGKVDEEKAAAKRAELFNLIEDLVQWDNSNNPTVINKARAEIARCVASRKIELGELDKATITFGKDKGKKHKAGPLSNEGVTAYEVLLMRARPEVVNAFLAEYAPPVLDPFCGGGSIPLEAQRLGLRAYGSDLNPVPVLITKALMEIPPKFAGKPPVNPSSNAKLKGGWIGAQGLAEDVRYYGKWMRDEAEKRIGQLYPKVKITKEMAKDRPDLKPYVGEELTVIAWLWARTVASPNPVVGGTHVPLARTFVISNKKGNEAWVEPVIDKAKTGYHFCVRVNTPPVHFDPKPGTVSRKGGICTLTGVPMPFNHIRAEAKSGRMSCRLMAIAAEGARGRVFLDPLETHGLAGTVTQTAWRPGGEMPKKHRNFQAPVYGMNTFGDLFSSRQLVALNTFADLVEDARSRVLTDSRSGNELTTQHEEYATAVATYLAFAIDKAADYWTTLCFWHNGAAHLKIVNTFGRQAIPMSWDWAEANPFSDSSGHFFRFISLISEVLDICVPAQGFGQVDQLDAAQSHAPRCQVVVCTDPPYYDNINYADLSDFFYVWLRRTLRKQYPQLLATLLTPKSQELVASSHRFDGDANAARVFFEKGLREAFGAMRGVQSDEAPVNIFYAFKQAEESEVQDNAVDVEVASTGWETMLEGVMAAGFAVVGTWPMRTEYTGNLKKTFASLASSIVLTCRPREAEAVLTTRRDFLNSLKRELPDALKNLQRGNIAPVDLAQAAIGPGMAVFTRYSKVMETDGSAMSVRTALGLINQALDEVLAEQEGEFDGDTRWALAWFEQFGAEEGAFGVAETLSKAKNTAVNGLVEAGVIKARAGKVRLLKRDELPDDWNPATDKRLTIWEVTQHLIRALDQKGESGAADLVRKLVGTAEIARDLAYRLYTICERKKWADEALAYNGLVIAWPELTKLAMAAPATGKARQGELFA